MLIERTHPRDGVALLTLNDPTTLNAMSEPLCEELSQALAEIEADDGVRVVVLTGAGRGFSSGHDFDGLATMPTDPAGGMVHQRLYSRLILQLNELSDVVIAAVNGPAAGGGMALALAADTRVASASARFNAAFVRLGISGTDVGTSYLLPRLVGPTLAFEMMVTGRLIDAQEALAAGLVLNVVPDGEVVDSALVIADRVLANSAFGVRMTKRGMWNALDAPSLRHAIELEDRTQMLCFQTGGVADALAAVRAGTRRREGQEAAGAAGEGE